MGMNSVFITIPNDGFRGRADNQFFFEFRFWVDDDSFAVRTIFQSIMGDHGTFLSKSCYVRSFFTEERFWDKQWEIGIHMSGIFEHLVEHISDVFSDGVAIRFDDHASSHIRIFCEIGDFDDVVVSFAIIFSACSYLCHEYEIIE